MPTTVIAERLGWKHSIRILRDRVREVRPAHLSLDPVSRTTYQPGEICQRYLSFPDIIGPVDERQHHTATRLPVVMMVTGYSLLLLGRCRPGASRTCSPGGGNCAPARRSALDSAGAGERDGRWRHGRAELTGEVPAFAITSAPRR